MTTALDLCTQAAQELGALESGESLTAQEAADCLTALNSMMDGWSVNKLLIYQIQQTQHSWPGSASSRTIGPAGDFNVTRPIKIEQGTFFRDSNNNDYPVEVVYEREVYDSIPLKTSIASVWPSYLFYDTAFPIATLYAWPVPSAATTLFLNSWKPLQNFTSLTTDLALPPGYLEAIVYNLAIRLASVFSLPVEDSTRLLAKETKALIESLNSKTMISQTDMPYLRGGLHRGLNILTGP